MNIHLLIKTVEDDYHNIITSEVLFACSSNDMVLAIINNFDEEYIYNPLLNSYSYVESDNRVSIIRIEQIEVI